MAVQMNTGKNWQTCRQEQGCWAWLPRRDDHDRSSSRGLQVPACTAARRPHSDLVTHTVSQGCEEFEVLSGSHNYLPPAPWHLSETTTTLFADNRAYFVKYDDKQNFWQQNLYNYCHDWQWQWQKFLNFRRSGKNYPRTYDDDNEKHTYVCISKVQYNGLGHSRMKSAVGSLIFVASVILMNILQNSW